MPKKKSASRAVGNRNPAKGQTARRKPTVAVRGGMARRDPRSVPVPNAPASITDLIDAQLKNRALIIWTDSHRLQIVLDIWQQWFRDLKKTGDADPALAIRCHETVSRCLEVLWPSLVTVRPSLGDSLNKIASRLPRLPSGTVAGKDVSWNSTTKKWIEEDRVEWQHETALWNSYHTGNLDTGCGAMHSLVGAASHLVKMLEHDPESFFRNMAIQDDKGKPQSPAQELASRNAQGIAISERVDEVERVLKSQKKPPTRREQIRNQRIRFACSKRRKNPPKTWAEIYEKYAEKYPRDTTASSETLRLSHDRNCQECRPITDS